MLIVQEIQGKLFLSRTILQVHKARNFWDNEKKCLTSTYQFMNTIITLSLANFQHHKLGISQYSRGAKLQKQLEILDKHKPTLAQFNNL